MKRKDGLFQRAKDGPWYCIVQWDGERYCECSKTTLRTEAKAFLEDMKVQLRKGTYVRPKNRKAEKKARALRERLNTVGALSDRWLDVYVAVNRNEKGQKLTRVRAERYLKPFMGDLPLTNVTKDTLRQYRAYLEGLKTDGSEERRLSDQSVRHLLADIRCVFTWAHDAGHIDRLPVPRKLLPPQPDRDPRGLSTEEQEAVSALEGPLGLCNRIMLGSGVRWSELCRLTSADIVAGEIVVRGPTKNHKSRRIPIAPVLVAELKGHVGKLVPFEPSDNSAFCRLVQRASGVAEYSAHRCRHTYALNYLAQGGNIRVLQQNLGHSSLAVTEIYLRIEQQMAREDAKRVMGWSATA